MPLDALDQKTLTSLPRLSEVYDAYGVQVNALSVDEILLLRYSTVVCTSTAKIRRRTSIDLDAVSVVDL